MKNKYPLIFCISLSILLTGTCSIPGYTKPNPPRPHQPEVIFKPDYHKAIWIPRHWGWRGRNERYIWIPGHWVGRKQLKKYILRNYTRTPGRWEWKPRSRKYVWRPGLWRKRP